MAKWTIKPFSELSAPEVYQILGLRSEVFVVEQNCVYQDIDGKDFKALHLIGRSDNEIVAYARLFDIGIYFPEASIGRVAIKLSYRGKHLGHELMKEAIEGIKKHFDQSSITISAQLYLKKFYESHGFIQIGESYLEDGIPHIRMEKK